MARSWFGGTPEAIAVRPTIDRLLRIVPGAPITLWSAKTAGTQYTDLLLAGVPVDTITADDNAVFPRFQGPDAVAEMWADGLGVDRLLLRALPLIIVVPTGTTGYASQPDGTLWIEYTP